MIRLVRWTSAAVVALLAASLVYVVYRMQRLPENAPAAFLTRGRSSHDQRVVVCLGASLVHGSVCVNFVDMLARRFSATGYVFVNAGVNGDTSYHALQRLDSVIGCDPDFVVVLVGTNDVICTINPRAANSYWGEKRLPRTPDVEWYRENLREIVRRLKQSTRARIGFCSLPPMGEDLSSRANRIVRDFNDVIREVAEQEEAAYIPVYENQEAYLVAQNHTSGRAYTGDARESLRLGFTGNLQHYLFGCSYDAISRNNGLVLCVDLIHSNSQGARLIADSIERFLRGQEMQAGVPSAPKMRGTPAGT